MSQHMHSIGEIIKTTTTGYQQTIKKYQAKNCEGCPLRAGCHKAVGNRIIDIKKILVG